MAKGLATKQNVVTDDALEIRHTRYLQDTLDGKQNLIGDVQGTGVSLRHGGNLRKVYGHGGVAIEATVNLADGADPTNMQLRVSGEQLQTSIASLGTNFAALSATVAGINPSTFLPNTGPATLTGNLTVTGASTQAL